MEKDCTMTNIQTNEGRDFIGNRSRDPSRILLHYSSSKSSALSLTALIAPEPDLNGSSSFLALQAMSFGSASCFPYRGVEVWI